MISPGRDENKEYLKPSPREEPGRSYSRSCFFLQLNPPPLVARINGSNLDQFLVVKPPPVAVYSLGCPHFPGNSG